MRIKFLIILSAFLVLPLWYALAQDLDPGTYYMDSQNEYDMWEVCIGTK